MILWVFQCVIILLLCSDRFHSLEQHDLNITVSHRHSSQWVWLITVDPTLYHLLWPALIIQLYPSTGIVHPSFGVALSLLGVAIHPGPSQWVCSIKNFFALQTFCGRHVTVSTTPLRLLSIPVVPSSPSQSAKSTPIAVSHGPACVYLVVYLPLLFFSAAKLIDLNLQANVTCSQDVI